jgi:hypothetical protein
MREEFLNKQNENLTLKKKKRELVNSSVFILLKKFFKFVVISVSQSNSQQLIRD